MRLDLRLCRIQMAGEALSQVLGLVLQTDLQGEAQIRSAEVSLLAIVAAVQVVEKKMEPQAAWLQSLEGCTRTAEEKLADCEKVAVKFGNQLLLRLEGKWAMLGTLLQEYGLLQRQLENVLCNRNFWILWLPPGSKGEAPKVPVTPEDTVGYFSEQQGGGLEDSQKELYKRVVKGSCETLSSLGLQRTALPLPFSSLQAGPPPSQIFWCHWRKDTRQAAAACPVRRGARAWALTQASWKHPRSSGLDQARGRGKWEEPAGPTGDHCGTPVLRDLSEPQRGVWREGPRDTSQPGLLEGGLARRAVGEAPVGVCFLTPGSERWPSSLQALQARLSPLLGAWSSAHLAPSGARASAGRSSARSRNARIMPHGLSLVLSVPRASRTGPLPPATARRMWPSAPTPAPDAVRPLSTSRRSHPLPHAHRGEALRVRRVRQGLRRPAACRRCWSTGTHTSARSPSSVRSATSASRAWPT
ncbi:PREDICTED: LOW QUALITY PROTEIN: zinc finger protein 282-like [Cercocebus atys]|uniref:LOW QUALITY PROTEIN: zinc finger protein 282-like n=1 Tax=Cercocebus atys TaxID=9531 RepID=UPI0005F4B9BC|nr:PREDICTED: LOW QUALITY PROTEIN: zinc finger protein 282-like [Cercocebus atys]